MPTCTELMSLAAAYALGCFPTGYALVRWRTGRDIRTVGSGSTGARNVGRVLGRAGFAWTLLVDAGKGALAVGGARCVGARETYVALAMLAVVVGHVWPVPLRFHGGKGVAPSIGALLAFDAVIAAMLAAIFLCCLLAARRVAPSALVATILLPVAVWLLGYGRGPVAATLALATVVIAAHRVNLREARQGRAGGSPRGS